MPEVEPIKIRGHVDGQSESFWVAPLPAEPHRGHVLNVLYLLPLSIDDEVEFAPNAGGYVLTRLVRRSHLTTIATVIDPPDGADLAVQAAVEQVRQNVARELERRGASVEGGMGIIVAAREDVTTDDLGQIVEEQLHALRLDDRPIEVFQLCSPTDPVDIAITPPPPDPTPEPLSQERVDAYLSHPSLWVRHRDLVRQGDIPSPLELAEIVQASINSAAYDRRLRDAWVEGRVDVALVMGARFLAIGHFPLPDYPTDIYSHFTHRVTDWPVIP